VKRGVREPTQLTSLNKLKDLLDQLVLCQRVRDRRQNDNRLFFFAVVHGHLNVFLAHLGKRPKGVLQQRDELKES
jgi:hypothetical protein